MMSPAPFYAAAVVFAAAGAALRLAPVSVPAAGASAAGAAAPEVAPPERPTVGADRYVKIVSANAFSSSRTAPAPRWVPEGLRRDTQPVARAPRKAVEIPPRLFGISRGPGGAVALIDADPAVPGAELYEVGDAVRGGRVSAIGDSTVTLSRPSGPLVLRLPDAGERR